MAYLTGINGGMNGINCLKRYRVIDRAMPAMGVCSDSDGATFLAEGNTDWQTVAVAYGGTPAANPGDTFSFSCNDGQVGYQGDAYVDKVRIFWDVEQAKFLYHEIYFSSNGELSAGGSAGTPGTPNPASALGLGSTVGGGSFDIRRAMLEVSCPGVPFWDSGNTTAGVAERKQGNFAAAFELEAYTKATLPAKNSLEAFSIQVSDSDSWDLSYMMITEAVSEMSRGDDNGRAVGNSCRLKGRWSGWKAGAKGVITPPSGGDIWPSA